MPLNIAIPGNGVCVKWLHLIYSISIQIHCMYIQYHIQDDFVRKTSL